MRAGRDRDAHAADSAQRSGRVHLPDEELGASRAIGRQQGVPA